MTSTSADAKYEILPRGVTDMGLLDDSGRHEGWLGCVSADGAAGSGWSSGGVTVTIDGQGRRLGYDDWSSRPEADVVGWRVGCDCVPAHVEVDEGYGGQRELWLSCDIWVRVHSPDEEDLSAGRIYAPADGAWAVDDRDDVAELVLARWHRHTGPDVASAAVREAWQAARAAADRLDAAVVAAPAAGATWAEIARATSMVHQSAQQRWGTFTGEIATAKSSRAVLPLDVPIADRLRDRLARPQLPGTRETLQGGTRGGTRLSASVTMPRPRRKPPVGGNTA